MEELPLKEIAVNEFPFNLLCRAIEYDTLLYCVERGMGVICSLVLLQGIFVDIYSNFDDIWCGNVTPLNKGIKDELYQITLPVKEKPGNHFNI